MNGIYYNYNEGSNRASVSETHERSYSDSYSNEYSGDTIIPESVTYNDKIYSVTSIGNYAER